MTADDVIERLRIRFTPPRHALFVEVANATGFAANRHIDALAVGLWPSEGMEVEGIEIKVSRGDWLRELKQPEKSAAISRFCDRFWLAVPDAALVRDGELPAGWGLLVCTDEACGVRVRSQAAKLDAEPLSRTFIAAIARAAYKSAPAVRGAAEEIKRAERRGKSLAEDAARRAARKYVDENMQAERKWSAEYERSQEERIAELEAALAAARGAA